eukprot:1159640-Pelagomonas_calceolata.AAC.14
MDHAVQDAGRTPQCHLLLSLCILCAPHCCSPLPAFVCCAYLMLLIPAKIDCVSAAACTACSATQSAVLTYKCCTRRSTGPHCATCWLRASMQQACTTPPPFATCALAMWMRRWPTGHVGPQWAAPKWRCCRCPACHVDAATAYYRVDSVQCADGGGEGHHHGRGDRQQILSTRPLFACAHKWWLRMPLPRALKQSTRKWHSVFLVCICADGGGEGHHHGPGHRQQKNVRRTGRAGDHLRVHPGGPVYHACLLVLEVAVSTTSDQPCTIFFGGELPSGRLLITVTGALDECHGSQSHQTNSPLCGALPLAQECTSDCTQGLSPLRALAPTLRLP